MIENYKEQLKDPRWIEKRNRILSRDNNTCQYCGCRNRYMNIHHKYYIEGHKPWEYDDDSLITLCDRCHETETNDSREEYEIFKSVRFKFKKFGFSDAVFNTFLLYIESHISFIGGEDVYEKEYINDEKYKLINAIIANCILGGGNMHDALLLNKLGTNEYDKHIEEVKQILNR